MLGMVKQDGQGNKYLSQIAGATLGQGVPLGTWCSFEKDVAPSSNWLMAGSTFDASVYPALALYLGTNKVPERYATYKDTRVFMDLNNPNSSLSGSITILNASHVTSMEVLGETRSNQQENAILAVDLTTATSLVFGFGGGGYTLTLSGTYDATTDTWTIANAVGRGLFVNYDELGAVETRHPLFIKATSIASDTDQQAILAQIQEYNTYSTEETLTGKTWIDGKPIYRKVFYLSNPAINWTRTALDVSNVDWITKREYTARRTNGASVLTEYYNHDSDNYEVHLLLENGVLYYFCQSSTALSAMSVTIEYTKTTD